MWVVHTSKCHQEGRIKSNPFSWLCISNLRCHGKEREHTSHFHEIVLIWRNSLVVQWLDLCAFTAEGLSSIPGGRTKIPQVSWYSQKKKKKSCLSGVTWGHADEVWMDTENPPHHPLAPPLPSFLGLHFQGDLCITLVPSFLPPPDLAHGYSTIVAPTACCQLDEEDRPLADTTVYCTQHFPASATVSWSW